MKQRPVGIMESLRSLKCQRNIKSFSTSQNIPPINRKSSMNIESLLSASSRIKPSFVEIDPYHQYLPKSESSTNSQTIGLDDIQCEEYKQCQTFIFVNKLKIQCIHNSFEIKLCSERCQNLEAELNEIQMQCDKLAKRYIEVLG
ncbi:Hypothetical_protein [Hexamita inflata]|uniref:Hypothetical_protein n=1 Tax=Hexamita inflata TaxID=28002 RepID=A0AA86NKQ2_9EUKA|nr:Hypothetical protein HINF_LOCUS8423 [Hexamita inflata]